MSLKYDFMNSEAEAREVEFVLPNGEKTGFHLTLLHESAPEIKAIERRYRGKFIQAARQGKRGNSDKLQDELMEERRLAYIKSWRFDEDSIISIGGVHPEFSKENAKALLSARGLLIEDLKSFIDDIAGDAADFLESVGNN